MGKRTNKQAYEIGAVISIETEQGEFFYLIATPQYLLFELLEVKSRCAMSVNELLSASRQKLPYTICAEPIATKQWNVIGTIAEAFRAFVPQHFLMGGRATCGSSVLDKHGYLLVDSMLKTATEHERKVLPKFKIMGVEVVEDLRTRLQHLRFEE
jgi:hypothetical protein